MPPEIKDNHPHQQGTIVNDEEQQPRFVTLPLSMRDIQVVCEFDKIVFPDEYWCPKRWRHSFQNSYIEGMVLVTPQPNGQQHRQLVGVCSIRTDDDEDECVVETLGIAKEFRKKNLGKRLLLSCLAKMVANFCTLHVRCSNASATGLYLSLGFQITEIVAEYYENPAEDAFLMVLSEEKLDDIKSSVN
eukprot:TRINITY_DN14386_c0_g1_i1.p1 TRINITY_DN14386_c0_g1~~TRINITY_DN14386_c0_g1_i1.p1  ORF type:complete len:188 (+),score=26.00 TRINITY_DN14386_c0_g1_i1:219-782(+)